MSEDTKSINTFGSFGIFFPQQNEQHIIFPLLSDKVV